MEENTKDIHNGENNPQNIQQSSSIVYQNQETQLESNELETKSVKCSESLSEKLINKYRNHLIMRNMEENTKDIHNGDNNPQNIQQSSSLSFQNQETQLESNELDTKSVKGSESLSEILKEVAIQSVDLNVASCSNAPFPISLVPKESNSCPVAGKAAIQEQRIKIQPRLPIIVINSRNSPTKQSPITIQPSRNFSSIHSLLSPMSLITSLPNQPQSLFLQALAILNRSSVMLEKSLKSEHIETDNDSQKLSTPDSLTSAPPSYSFVLRQSMARRRPRLMGTFIPSPSYVTRTPPPNYAAAFDIYLDTPLPPQPQRLTTYTFGFTPMPIICPECGYAGLTSITSKVTLCTHLCALMLCLFCCWVCAPLPYLMSSCKDVYHYCRNCRNFLGMYSPSTPETTYPMS